MIKNKFKIFDNQTFTYKNDGNWFTEKEAIEYLANYHSTDYTGRMMTPTGYESCTIEQKLESLRTDTEQLVYLCEYGDWDTHEVVFWNEQGVCTGGDYLTALNETLENDEQLTAETRQYYE